LPVVRRMKAEVVSKINGRGALACFGQCWWRCEHQWHWVSDGIKSAIFPRVVAAAVGGDGEEARRDPRRGD
jgi:hypothetical protein